MISIKGRRSAAAGKGKRILRFAVIAAAALIAVYILCGLNGTLRVAHYEIHSPKLTGHIRIALLTDLHSCAYGKDMSDLIEAIDAENPDVVLLGGDIFDDELPPDNVITLLKSIAPRCDCRYVTGNHEYWSDRFDEDMESLAALGVIRLENTVSSVVVNGTAINLCGIDDPTGFFRVPDPDYTYENTLAALSEACGEGVFTVLLAHRPEFIETYARLGFDLALCGHTHGGHWRLPPFNNGVYAPNQGLFPGYAGGLYVLNDTSMIVSRGLARESTRLPRLYNRPELVIVDLSE